MMTPFMMLQGFMMTPFMMTPLLAGALPLSLANLYTHHSSLHAKS